MTSATGRSNQNTKRTGKTYTAEQYADDLRIEYEKSDCSWSHKVSACEWYFKHKTPVKPFFRSIFGRYLG